MVLVSKRSYGIFSTPTHMNDLLPFKRFKDDS